MSVEFRPLKDEFERKIKTATKQAGRAALKDIKIARKRSLGKTSSRRKKAITGGISKDGEAIIIRDSASLAKAQEYGERVYPKNGKFLRVPIAKSKASSSDAFIRNDKRGNPHIFEKTAGNELRLIATLKKSVKITPLKKKLIDIAKERFPKYLDDIDRNLTK